MNQLLATLVLLMTLRTAQAATLYPSIQAEIKAGITPTDYSYAPGDTRRYGALENGSTDDTAAIRRALSIAGPFAVTQHGTSVVTSTLNIPSGILYTGSSRSAGLVCRLAKNANCIDFGNVTHSGISHMKILGPGINSRAEVGGINFAMGATLDYADDVEVSGFPGMPSSGHAVGITILGADITVRNSRIENNTFGVAVSGPRAMIINNFVSNHYSTYRKWPWLRTYPYWDGIVIGNCSECLIQNNVLTDNGQSGIYVGGNGSLAARVTIEGNSVSYNWNRGIDLGLQIARSGSNNVIRALVVGNLAYNNHENNFWLAGVADTTVTGNTAIYDAGYKSWPGFGAYPGTHINIGLYDGAAGDALVGCTITGNTTTDNLGKVGISFSYAITPPHGCIISGNTVDSAYYIYGKAAYINNRVDVVSSR